MNAQPKLGLRVFLPFAAAYWLSYLLRTTNAVLAPELTRELGLSAADLGLLTSAYFIAFGAFQLPLGLLLDRYGARRVEATLLVFTAAGCGLFAVGRDLWTLVAARALIGLGVSACLMAALKYLFQCFPPLRHASLTGAVMVAGGLGALSSSLPLAWALPHLGWRGVFAGAVLVTLLVIGALLTVPELPPPARHERLGEQLRGLAGIFRRFVFWRIALLSGWVVGGNMALQGLWALPWLMTVNGYSRAVAADHLFILGCATLAGYLAVASFATRLARRGIPPILLFGAGCLLTLAATVLILLDAASTRLLWLLMGLGASTTNLGYSLVAAHFPPAVSGRVSTAVNLLVFIGAFAVQWGFGLLVDGFRADGWTAVSAYRGAFGVLLALQAASFLVFLAGGRKQEPLIHRRGAEAQREP